MGTKIAICVSYVFLAVFFFTVPMFFEVDPIVSSVLFVVQFLAQIYLLYVWYVIDLRQLNMQGKLSYRLFLLIFPLVAYPIHFFRTRKIPRALVSTAVFFSVTLLIPIIVISHPFISSFVSARENISAILNYQSNDKFVVSFIEQYKRIQNSNYTVYIDVSTAENPTIYPQEYIKDDQITLNLSPKSIDDFKWHDGALSFKASFGGQENQLYIPFSSVKAIYSAEDGIGISFR
ncbi:ClpXP protease specificity-enhancing factor SspB [uncultured Pseudoteredinibacter sp.]|uniref:ClpXP protease specificity-enhancing factor SspB n=1 Tax=uncultured Pseudoteredinibacter sp. TaxID=1641701 RepID=UPI002605C757|nr:ClpXP protease specificity-enhancing factor SspB [uncultured Pseudoteredinibacter sp.]